MRTILLILVTFLCAFSAHAQGDPERRIMVIPFTKDGEDIRTVLDRDANRRIAITRVQEAFDDKGYTTVDFVGRLKAARDARVFTSENQADIKSQIIEMAACDIYVVVDVDAQSDHTGASVNVALTAYDIATGNSLANKVGTSGKFFTNDFGKLTARAVNNCADDFVNTMSRKFDEMAAKGKSLFIDFSFAENSTANMTTPIERYNKMPLSELLENWLAKNSINGAYHIQGITKLKLVADEVHIPVLKSNGVAYSTNEFAVEVCKFINTTGLTASKDVRAGSIFITIN
ncbi:MAG: hypothetical protein KF744_10765 [Taibaiella sp.]|nr:hypothetical protein [Taibaiella sp.]